MENDYLPFLFKDGGVLRANFEEEELVVKIKIEQSTKSMSRFSIANKKTYHMDDLGHF